MNVIPKKVSKCPIEESILEIRFETEFPPEAVFGIIFASIRDYFKTSKPQILPVQQIPENIRIKDPNLMYQPIYRLQDSSFSLSIGPRSLLFGNSREYSGWESWSEFFTKIIMKVQDTGVINRAERLGLRYINIFDKNILNQTTIDVSLKNKSICNQPLNLRTEFNKDGLIQVVQVGNSVNIIKGQVANIGSVIDIDCIYNFKQNDAFFSMFNKIVNKAHDAEKELFYSLLKDDFIESLGPIY